MLVFGDAHIFIYTHQCLLTLALHPNDHHQLPMKPGNLACGSCSTCFPRQITNMVRNSE